MPDEALISQIETLLAEVVELGAAAERTRMVPNLLVTDAAPTGLTGFITVKDDRDSDNILARTVPSVIYSTNDLVNVLFVRGGEAIAFQQGSQSGNSGLWEIVPSTTTDIFYNKGQVGIGVTTPAAALEVNAATASRDGLIIQSTDDDNTNELLSVQLSAGTEIINASVPVAATLFRALTIDTSGVSTGARSIPATFSYDDDSTDLEAAVSSGLFVENKNQTVNNYVSVMFVGEDTTSVQRTVGHIACVITDHTLNTIDTDIAFIVRDAGSLSEKIRLKSDGDFGIGTSAPQDLLQVGPGTDAPSLAVPGIYVAVNGDSRISIRNNTDNIETFMRSTALNGRIGTITNHDFSVRTNNVDRIFIENTGDVGIGTATPSTRLDIDAGALEFAEMTAPGAGAGNTARDYAVDDGSGNTQRSIVFSSGDIVVIAQDGGLATYTPTNVTTDRSYDADSTTVAELADVLGTLIADFQTAGVLS